MIRRFCDRCDEEMKPTEIIYKVLIDDSRPLDNSILFEVCGRCRNDIEAEARTYVRGPLPEKL